ncbi:MAG: VanZ family protein [Candidatus Omnitrophota bacterium]
MAKEKQFYYWIPILLYGGVIFFFSSLPADSVPVLFAGSDKLFHFLEYFCFGLLLSFALQRTSNKYFNSLLVVFFMVLFFSLSDEIHQLFVPGRQFSYADIFFDILGGLTGGCLYRWRK